MSKKKLMALLLSGVMTATTVSVPVFAEDADAAEDTADAAEETEGGSSDTPLVVGQTNFSEKFCGMFAEAVPDQQISERLLSIMEQSILTQDFLILQLRRARMRLFMTSNFAMM